MPRWKLWKEKQKITGLIHSATENTPVAVVIEGQEKAVRQLLRQAEFYERIAAIMKKVSDKEIAQDTALFEINEELILTWIESTPHDGDEVACPVVGPNDVISWS